MNFIEILQSDFFPAGKVYLAELHGRRRSGGDLVVVWRRSVGCGRPHNIFLSEHEAAARSSATFVLHYMYVCIYVNMF